MQQQLASNNSKSELPRIDPNNTDIILTTRHDEISSESVSNSHENSNPTPPTTTENEMQSPKETTCPHFLTGHCSKKQNCVFKHDVATCKFGRNCPNKSKTCFLRHPRICTRFLNKKCGFTNSKGMWVNYRNCSYIHQVPEPHIHLQPNLDHANHHEVSEAPNNCQETIQNDLSTALLKIEALEKSVQQLKENIKGIEAENLDHKKQLQEQQYLIACLSSNSNNKKSNNETPSLEPGVQLMNKDTISTIDSEVSGSNNGNPVASGGMEEAEKGDGNEEKEPEKVNAFNNQVPSSANSKADSPNDIAAEERLGVTEEQPKRVTWSLHSHDNHSVLDKVKKAFYIGSPPTGAVPKKKSKDKTNTEVAQPVAKCDNCRTDPCLDSQVITTKNLVLQEGPFKYGKTYQKSDFKGILRGKNVTGVVQIHKHNRYKRFMHYIEGERQTWNVEGEEKEWAPFTNDISTLLYRCKR